MSNLGLGEVELATNQRLQMTSWCT